MNVSFSWVEVVGYVASLLVAISLTMSNVKRLRWVNLAGATVFSIYGILVDAWPVFAVNAFVACVDVYYLVRMRTEKDFFTLVHVEGVAPLTRKFLRFYANDIARFFPDFDPEQVTKPGFFVLRNLLPVGLVLYEPRDDGSVEITLDYVVPEYRDHKNAEFVYRILNEQLSAEGHHQLLVRSRVRAHRQYLEREGFEAQSADPELYRKAII
jgi:hypothetical protein